MWRRLVEEEAGAMTAAGAGGLVRSDRIGEAAGVADDRHRAVAHGDELAQPARLVARRHQEEIAAAEDELAQRFVEVQAHRHLLRIAGRQRQQRPRVLLVALA